MIGGTNTWKAFVKIPAAKVLTLSSNPVQIIPAPGPGLFLHVFAAIVRYNFKTTPYSAGGSIILTMNTPGLSDLWGTLLNTSITASHSTLEFGNIGPMGGGNIWDVAAVNKASFNLTMLTGNPAGGDGNLDIAAYYTIEQAVFDDPLAAH